MKITFCCLIKHLGLGICVSLAPDEISPKVNDIIENTNGSFLISKVEKAFRCNSFNLYNTYYAPEYNLIIKPINGSPLPKKDEILIKKEI